MTRSNSNSPHFPTGKTATHAVLMARLMVRGRDYGPHSFIVPLRSLEDHRPLPGVTVGDLGPKFGYGGVDNGFMRMEYLRIPRDNMLMRFAKVRGQCPTACRLCVGMLCCIIHTAQSWQTLGHKSYHNDNGTSQPVSPDKLCSDQALASGIS